MNPKEAFEAIRRRPIFELFTEEQVQALAADSEYLSFEIGQEIPKSRHPQDLFVVVQGRVAKLAAEDHSIHRGSARQGEPLELKALLAGDERWSCDWVVEEPVGLLKIAKQRLMNALEADPELLDYLQKITLNPELQRFRNDIRLCGFNALEIQKTIAGLALRAQETQENETGSSLLIVKTGGISLKKVADEEASVSGHYIAGDYLFFEGKKDEEELSFEPDTQAWFISVTDWELSVERSSIENFLHFLNPEEMEITDSDENKSLEDRGVVEKPAAEKKDEGPKLSVKDFFLTPKELAKIHKKKFQHVLQHDAMDCGAACMATIAKHHGRRISLPSYRSLVHVTRDGASMLALKKAAVKTGFDTIGVMSGCKGLKKLQAPFVALMEYHFVVIYKVTDDEVVMADPARGMVTQPLAEFKKEYSQNALLLKPTKAFFKYPESSYSFIKYFELLRGTGLLLLETFLASLLVFLFGLGLPLFLQVVFDQFYGGGDPKLLNTLAIGLLALNLVSGVTNWVREYLLSHVTATLDAKLSSLFMRYVFKLPLNYFAVRNVGDLTTRLQEMSKIREVVTGQTLTLLLDLVSIVVYTAVVWLYSPTLFVTVLAIALLNFAFVGYMTPKIATHLKDEYRAQGKNQSVVYESFKSLKTIKSLSGGVASRWRWSKTYLEAIKLNRKSNLLFEVLGAGNGFFVELGKAVLLFVSVYLYFQQELSLGQVVAVHTIAASIMAPLVSLLDKWETISEAGVSLARIDDVVTAACEADPADRIERNYVLRGMFGPLEGQQMGLSEGDCTLGTASGNDIDLSQVIGASRKHARLSFTDGRYTLRDLDSKNGTLVNRSRVMEKNLNIGDRIRIGSTEMVFEYLEERQNSGDGTVHGDILFDDVSFQYGSEMSPIVLNRVSLQIKEGETVAIVGRSGCGKTTLAYMLNLLYAPTKGTIRIGDVPSTDIPLRQLRNSIAMIVQDNHIFSGSILDNISLGDPHPSFERVIEAAKGADAHDFVTKMAKGYLTELAESGEGLSGGQKQRLNIARALYKNPRILIMDEATSALDAISEQNVVNHLKTFTQGMTTLIIAHRLNTIMHADRIIVLDAGQVIEQGTHQELVELGGQYYELFRKQVQI
jgi:ATP-binding cassette, subfamily C, bacterial